MKKVIKNKRDKNLFKVKAPRNERLNFNVGLKYEEKKPVDDHKATITKNTNKKNSDNSAEDL